MRKKFKKRKYSNSEGEYRDAMNKIYKKHYNQNRRIRKSLKPIIKPDLDKIMEEALND